MSESREGLDFSTVIASTVHDMKNSLAMLTQTHNQWIRQMPEAQLHTRESGVIEYEFARLNGMLVQLLGLYKLGVNQLPLQPAYLEVEDFLEEQIARHFEVLQSRHIEARCEVEEFGLMGVFDHNLIGSVVSNIITNSIRYARQQLLLRAWEEQGTLVLSVCDDGEGHPEAMLAKQSDYVLGINHSTGSTGLGLYFSGRIAELHERNGVRGHIEISNGGPLGGGELRIYLP